MRAAIGMAVAAWLILSDGPAMAQALTLPVEFDEDSRTTFLGTAALTITAMLRASELTGREPVMCLGRSVTQADVWMAATRELAGVHQPAEIIVAAVRQLVVQYPCR